MKQKVCKTIDHLINFLTGICIQKGFKMLVKVLVERMIRSEAFNAYVK